uniref:Nucleotidyltransferase family protein n=1 Tax=Schlesneria paludicola TaxID=360056 RepID=A0A7C4LN32_9PLAN
MTSPLPALRVFAVIPAAGRSRRMGQPKLLLPLGGRTILAHVLAALDLPEVVCRAVILRSDDAALRAEAVRCRANVIIPPRDPPDMRASVECGLAWIQAAQQPADHDAWLLLPADHPLLDRGVLAHLLDHFSRFRPAFLVPTFRGRRGHPLLARWDTVPELRSLPPDVGLNHLLRQRAGDVRELAVESPTVLCDLDTPEDYARLLRQFDAPPTTA